MNDSGDSKTKLAHGAQSSTSDTTSFRAQHKSQEIYNNAQIRQISMAGELSNNAFK
jgi:hypothetical protein